MRAVLGAVVIAALAAAGWWWAGARAIEAALPPLLAGPDVRAESWDLSGFPARFAVALQGVRLSGGAGPGGWTWEIPALEANAMVWAPHRLILGAASPQRLVIGGVAQELRFESLRGSLELAPKGAQELREAVLIGARPALGALEAQALRVAIARQDATGYRLGLALDALATGDGPASVRVDATGRWASAPGAQALQAGALPRPERLEIRSARLDWAGAFAEAQGTLAVRPDGQLEGPVSLRIGGLERGLAALARSGLLGEAQAERLRAVAAGIGQTDGTVTLPIVLRGGRILLGGLVPLGPAPALP